MEDEVQDAAELRERREDVGRTLKQKATVTRQAGSTEDGQGGTIPGEPIVRELVPCRVLPMSRGLEMLVSAQISSQTPDVKIIFAWNDTINDGDSIVVDGLHYEIINNDRGKAEASELVCFGVKK